jgi:hypothetical protein
MRDGSRFSDDAVITGRTSHDYRLPRSILLESRMETRVRSTPSSIDSASAARSARGPSRDPNHARRGSSRSERSRDRSCPGASHETCATTWS